MRRLALLLCSVSCAEWRMAPTFPRQAADTREYEKARLGEIGREATQALSRNDVGARVALERPLFCSGPIVS